MSYNNKVSYSLIIDDEVAGPLASLRGWSRVREHVLERAGRELGLDELAHLAETGWSDQLARLLAETQRVAVGDAPSDVRHTMRDLAAMLGEAQRDASLVWVSDGLSPELHDTLGLEFDPSQARDPEGTPTGGQWTGAMPSSVGDLKEVKSLGGSTGAKLFQDAAGKRWVVKGGASQSHAESEGKANQLYRKLGVRAPRSKMISGKLVTEFVTGTQLSQLTGEKRSVAFAKLRESFVVDALLGNWDVTGAALDNIVVDDKGQPWRIDNGGALEYRAQGGLKGAKWNEHVSEIDTMRAPGFPAGQVFAGITTQEIGDQVVALTKRLEAHPDALGTDPMLKARLETLQKKYAPHPDVKGDHPSLDAVLKSEATVTGNFMGATIGKKVTNLKAAAKMNDAHAKKIALMNDHGDDDTMWLPHTLDKAAVNALKKTWPNKSVKIVKASEFLHDKLDKYGVANVASLWHKSFDIPSTLPSGVAKAQTAKPYKPPKGLLGQAGKGKGVPQIEPPDEPVNLVSVSDHYSATYVNDPVFKRAALASSMKFKATQGNLSQIKDDIAKWEKSLSKDEKISVGHWGGSSYTVHEGELAKHAGDLAANHVNEIKAAETFRSALDKAPSFRGVVNRGMSFPTGTHAWELLTSPGNIVDFNISQSASRGLKGFGTNVLLRVATVSGKPVENLTGHISELEVVLQSGTSYRIAAVMHNVYTGQGHRTVIDLEELPKEYYRGPGKVEKIKRETYGFTPRTPTEEDIERKKKLGLSLSSAREDRFVEHDPMNAITVRAPLPHEILDDPRSL